MLELGLSFTEAESLHYYEESQQYLNRLSKVRQIEQMKFKADVAEAVSMAISASKSKKGLTNYRVWINKMKRAIDDLQQPEEAETFFTKRKKKKTLTLFDKMKASKGR